MTATQLHNYIGKRAIYYDKGFEWGVYILDAKRVYGITRFKIVPQAGTGYQWVNETSVSLETESSK